MKLKPLYARDSNGGVREWTIEVQGAKHRVTSGLVDGEQVTTQWTTCQPKNEGRSNATTAIEQAEVEAQAKLQKKIDSGYFVSIDDIDNEIHTEPMLAKKYEDQKDNIVWSGLYSQPKLDGVRLIEKKSGGWSRNGKPFVSMPHIAEALQPLFKEKPSLVFDGEAYCDKFANDFNAICSLVKKTKPTADDLAESAKHIQYWVYDLVDTTKIFSVRFNELSKYVKQLGSNSPVKLVDTRKVSDEKALDSLFEKYVEDGYEGQIVRIDAPYENKRSKFLLKRKEFMDQEYTILDVVEGVGNRSGTAGNLVCKLPDGRTFKSNIKGTREYVAQLLKDRRQLIGKQATIKFFNLTPSGIPRFGYAINIRDYE